jgi:hypothetical protein
MYIVEPRRATAARSKSNCFIDILLLFFFEFNLVAAQQKLLAYKPPQPL